MTYKKYVEKYKFPTDRDGDTILGEDFGTSGILQYNVRGELDIWMEDLFHTDPRTALHLLLSALRGSQRFASKQVFLTLLEAFHDAIDFSKGNLTKAGHAKYASDCGWLAAEAGTLQLVVDFEKIRHEPVAVEALRKRVYISPPQGIRNLRPHLPGANNQLNETLTP